MQRLLSIALSCLFAVTLSAQEPSITYPYNPDSNTDSLIGASDLVDFLPFYGEEFTPEPLTIEGMSVEEWMEQQTSSSGGWCDFRFPEGLHGEGISVDFHSNNTSYIVPEGKTLYILNIYADFYGVNIIAESGNPVYAFGSLQNNNSNLEGLSLISPIILKTGDIINMGIGGPAAFNGILVNSTGSVIAVTYDLSALDNNLFEVPEGKRLYVTHVTSNQNLFINESGTQITNDRIGMPLILNSQESLRGYNSFNGYLVDEDYFADCGGGGGSSEVEGGNGSSTGPTFINPIEIHGNDGYNKNVCENNDMIDFMTGIQYNLEGVLNQSIDNVILNIEFVITTSGLSYNCPGSALEMSSWNGTVTTPIMDYYYQSTQGTQSSKTLISKQVIIPLNNGTIDIDISGAGCCQVSEGQIHIVGYY